MGGMGGMGGTEPGSAVEFVLDMLTVLMNEKEKEKRVYNEHTCVYRFEKSERR